MPLNGKLCPSVAWNCETAGLHLQLVCHISLPRHCCACAAQIRGANILGLPVITTEQYPKALGNTVQELKDVLPPESPVVAKTLFSMLTPDVKELLKQKPAVSQVGSNRSCWEDELPAGQHMQRWLVLTWQAGHGHGVAAAVA
jgi:hypothetical protein